MRQPQAKQRWVALAIVATIALLAAVLLVSGKLSAERRTGSSPPPDAPPQSQEEAIEYFNQIIDERKAERAEAMGLDPDEMELGPGDCVKNTKPVELSLTSPDGTTVRFSIPLAYLDNDANRKQKPEQFISLRAVLRDMSPFCGSAEYAIEDNRQYSKSFVKVRVKPGTGDGVNYMITRYLTRNYPNLIGTEGRFDLYRSKKAVEENLSKGIKDFLVPQEGVFSKPSYVLCVRPGLSHHDGSRSLCSVTQSYSPQLTVTYSFYHTNLDTVTDIDGKVDRLLSDLIVAIIPEEEAPP